MGTVDRRPSIPNLFPTSTPPDSVSVDIGRHYPFIVNLDGTPIGAIANI